MGILDDAIREHLDLKRKHGAREAELREIEDEAFGSTEQADPFVAGSELFGEGSAGAAEPSGAASAAATQTPPPDLGNEEPTRLVEREALREQPPRPEPEPPSEMPSSSEIPGEMPSSSEMPSSTEMPSAPPEPAPEIGSDEPDLGSFEEPTPPPENAEPIPGQTELPGQDEIPGQEQLDEPIEGYRPSIESEPASQAPAPEPPMPEAPTREPPTPEPAAPSESLEELIAEEDPFPEDSAAPPPDLPVEPGPSADRGGALEANELEPQEEPEAAAPEPESSVPDPPPPPPATGPEPPGRARGRIDVPTQEHPPPGETGGLPAVPPPEAEPELEPAPEPMPEPEPAESGGPALYDFESDEEPLAPSPEDTGDDFAALGPAEEAAPYLEEEEEPSSRTQLPPEEPHTEVRPAVEDTGEEEASEGGSFDPEESYEEGDTDEDLWFEKGPPKDFDFD